MKTSYHFIVVDDDPFNNMVCKYTIQTFDPEASVRLFTKPEEAIAAIREEYSITAEDVNTILFLDINMPSMNGWEFLEEFETFSKKIQQQFTIYILSSSIDPADKHKSDKNPLVYGYFPKPLSLETINQIFN